MSGISAHNRDSSIIVEGVHCPYCNTDKALLMSRKTTSIIGLRFPMYGLKTILSILYLSLLHIWRYGYKTIEVTKQRVFSTYGFCPTCGNSYSASPPEEELKAEMKDPKFYRYRNGKAIMGYCKGVSEYTEIPLLWIRIMTALYGFTIIGTVFYFLISVCIPYKEDVEGGVVDGNTVNTKKLFTILGIIAGVITVVGILVVVLSSGGNSPGG